MGRAMHDWTRTACAVLLLSSFLACKKKSDEPAPAASVSPATERAAAAAASAAAAQAAAAASVAAAQAAAAAGGAAPLAVDAGAPSPVLGDVKRFADKEKAATGTTKILIDASKVYDEPDTTKPAVTTLSKDLAVTRVATLGSEWSLVEFPSGVGKVSPGWIESKSLVGGGGVSASVATSATAKAASSAAPAASASAKAVATAAPSAAPVAAATAAATAVTKPKVTGSIRRPSVPH